MKQIWVLPAALLLLSIGCGGASPMSKSAGRPPSDSANEAVARADEKAGGAGDKGKGDADAKPRKIIYNANAVLVVDDFDVAADQLKTLIDKEQGAWTAKKDINVSPNARRSGNWTIRVPFERLEPFMDEVAKLGELHQRTLDSRDITDEYYDLESRIKKQAGPAGVAARHAEKDHQDGRSHCGLSRTGQGDGRH